MIQSKILASEEVWSLSALESVFRFALEQKSKCLIQACVLIVEEHFSGVSSFCHETQVKFLLESIRHIINDHCQEEFIHVIQYLKLLHSLCPDIGCEEQYISSVLKIKQSFIFHTLIDNENVSDVCKLLNDFFPKDDPFQSFKIEKSKLKKRFLCATKRQIVTFQKLVTKLLTNMDFRQYYFYDEWTDDFGTDFHKEMISDIDIYLKRTEECLLSTSTQNKVYKRWMLPDSTANPAMLYFIKILTDCDSENIAEAEILLLLKWIFPSLDTAHLTMPCDGCLPIPDIFKEKDFSKLLYFSKINPKHFPWTSENFRVHLVKIDEAERDPDPENEETSPLSLRLYSKRIHKSNRRPFEELDPNTIQGLNRKRKRIEDKNVVQSSKRLRLCLTPISTIRRIVNSTNDDSSPKVTLTKTLSVNLSKENMCLRTPRSSHYDDLTPTSATLKQVNSPHFQSLLKSGSAFFTSAGKKHRKISKADSRTMVLTESSLDTVEFSDNEENASSNLEVADETMNGLTWISTSINGKDTPTSHQKRFQRTCRSLCFKSESSDEYVSESEDESSPSLQPTLQDCLKMLDLTYIPDLTYHLKPPTKPCVVKLGYLSENRTNNNLFEGCNISKGDLEIILNEATECKFRNHSSNQN